MANWKIWIVLVIISLAAQTEGKGARGGGGRFSSGRSGSRSSRTGSSSSRIRSTSYRTSRYGGLTWSTAMTAGYIYGSTSYMRRRMYSRYDEPSICYSREYNINSTLQGYFICPLEQDPDDYDYCCGPDDKEYCCRYFDDAGRVAGIVVACLVTAGIIGVACFICVKREYHGRVLSRVKSWRGTGSSSSHGAAAYVYNSAPPKPVTQDFSVQPPPYTMATAMPTVMTYDSPPGPDGKVSFSEDGGHHDNLPYSMNPPPPPGQGLPEYPYINPSDVQPTVDQAMYDNRGMTADDGDLSAQPPPPVGWTLPGAEYPSEAPPPYPHN